MQVLKTPMPLIPISTFPPSFLVKRQCAVYTGNNIENAAYTPSVCAERCAFFKAVSEGERDFAAIALCGGLKGVVKDYCAPCGVCRQVMREFCKPDFKIIMVKSEEEWKVYTLSQLLPEGFGPEIFGVDPQTYGVTVQLNTEIKTQILTIYNNIN